MTTLKPIYFVAKYHELKIYEQMPVCIRPASRKNSSGMLTALETIWNAVIAVTK